MQADVNIKATDGHSGLQGAHVLRSLTVVEYPPLDTTIISSCETLLRKTKLFLQLLLLPFHGENILRTLSKDSNFNGENIVTFRPGQLHFRYQIDLLKTESEGDYREWRAITDIALAVWVYEPYRIVFPVPTDINECFTIWVDDSADEVSGLAFLAL